MEMQLNRDIFLTILLVGDLNSLNRGYTVYTCTIVHLSLVVKCTFVLFSSKINQLDFFVHKGKTGKTFSVIFTSRINKQAPGTMPVRVCWILK
jgi:hypothetical protein